MEKENEIKPLVVNKLRIYETSSIGGIREFQKVYGVSEAEAVRMALHQFFDLNSDSLDKTTSTEKTNDAIKETLATLKTLKVSNRILIKKLFDLNSEEYEAFMKKAKASFDKD